ncbi:MAG: Hsp20/alpha crystallin family protein [Chthoniobacteraceae bacterium]
MYSLIRYPKTQRQVWTPFGRLSNLRDQLDRLFDHSFPALTPETFGAWTPALDVYQDKENVSVQVELPGLKKEDIEISLHDGVLTISGERKTEANEQSGQTLRSERFVGQFQRRVSLPTPVAGDKVSATYKDGVLTVTLPKAEEAKPKQIEVTVS